MEMNILINKQKLATGTVFSLPDVPCSDTGFICVDELLFVHFFPTPRLRQKLVSFQLM